MDGNGSIQINHWQKKYLQFRLVIKQKNTNANKDMLILQSKYVGGNVRIDSKQEFVLWVENDREKINIIIKEIYDVYPPLITRKYCQQLFLKKFINNTKDIERYFQERDNKYNLDPIILTSYPHYFGPWLSGLIEAKGCFSIRANNNHSFFNRFE